MELLVPLQGIYTHLTHLLYQLLESIQASQDRVNTEELNVLRQEVNSEQSAASSCSHAQPTALSPFPLLPEMLPKYVPFDS